MKKTLTDQDILAVAEKLFDESGFNKVRIIDIARQLDVSHTAIYKHFESKDLIFQILLKKQLATNPNLNLATQTGTTREKVALFLQALHQTYVQSAVERSEHFLSCVVYLRANMDFNDQHMQVTAEFMAQQTGLPLEQARDILHLTAFYHSPIYLDLWSKRDIEEDFARAWAMISFD